MLVAECASLANNVETHCGQTDPLRGVNWRNATLNNKALPRATLNALDTFELPETGTLVLDYVTTMKMHEDSPRREASQQMRAESSLSGINAATLTLKTSSAFKGKSKPGDITSKTVREWF